MSEPAEPAAVYRLYDGEYDLLYIGASRKPHERFKAHAHEKLWWHHVTYFDLTWFASFRSAAKAERAAQISERPPYNGVIHAGGDWNTPALHYDDSMDRAATREHLRAALNAGVYAPGTRLHPFHVSLECGYSRHTAWRAMNDLVKEKKLTPLISTFEVPAPRAPVDLAPLRAQAACMPDEFQLPPGAIFPAQHLNRNE
ncbi:hypothetical protein OG786_29260 [Streptomyces sp. NBC_00101]|uniref:GIY-YIG nuclease family protein n=1 Tax=Streptomyces sp. NBC_00101 TaxID=2975651 RepID=UPI0032546262